MAFLNPGTKFCVNNSFNFVREMPSFEKETLFRLTIGQRRKILYRSL
jgi:hypothetical protein